MTVSTSNTEFRLYDEAYWEAVEAAALATRARLSRSRMEVQSFFALSGQSTREDYHRSAADLYGMEPMVPGKSTGYTTFEKLAFALNHVVNEMEGVVIQDRRRVVVESTTFPVGLWMLCPERAVLAVANVVGFLAGRPAVVHPWRWETAEAGQRVLSTFSGTTREAKPGERCVRILVETTVERVTEERWVPLERQADPVWANPFQVDGGFTILRDSTERNLRKPGVEGLSVLVDKDGRFHVTYWLTARFPHSRIGRNGKAYTADRVGKKPLAVHSLPLGATEDDALREMAQVQSALERTAAYEDDPIESSLLPWQAAEMARTVDAPSTSVETITGSHDWLTAVADQRLTGQVYRSRGATADD